MKYYHKKQKKIMSTRTLRLFSQIRDFQSWLKREEFRQKILCFGLRLNKMVDCNKKTHTVFFPKEMKDMFYTHFLIKFIYLRGLATLKTI